MGLLTGFDLANAVSYLDLLAVALYTATANGPAVDISALGEPVIAVTFRNAAGTGTTPTMAISFEHSEDGSTWTAIPAAALTDSDGAATTFSTVTTTANKQTLALRKQLLKKYVRCVRTITGTTPSFAACVSLAGAKRRID